MAVPWPHRASRGCRVAPARAPGPPRCRKLQHRTTPGAAQRLAKSWSALVAPGGDCYGRHANQDGGENKTEESRPINFIEVNRSSICCITARGASQAAAVWGRP